jgi:hypothetical protein
MNDLQLLAGFVRLRFWPFFHLRFVSESEKGENCDPPHRLQVVQSILSPWRKWQHFKYGIVRTKGCCIWLKFIRLWVNFNSHEVQGSLCNDEGIVRYKDSAEKCQHTVLTSWKFSSPMSLTYSRSHSFPPPLNVSTLLTLTSLWMIFGISELKCVTQIRRYNFRAIWWKCNRWYGTRKHNRFGGEVWHK